LFAFNVIEEVEAEEVVEVVEERCEELEAAREIEGHGKIGEDWERLVFASRSGTRTSRGYGLTSLLLIRGPWSSASVADVGGEMGGGW
jgi:hypothetical protein